MIQCTFEDGAQTHLRHVSVEGLVTMGSKVLLAKRSMKVIKAPGKYCLPGGYLDYGESLFDAVRREILEETMHEVTEGILFHIRDTVTALPYTDRQDVAFVYLFEGARRVSNATLEWDSEQPVWAELKDIPSMKDKIALDHWYVIQALRKHREKNYTLPIFNAIDLLHNEL